MRSTPHRHLLPLEAKRCFRRMKLHFQAEARPQESPLDAFHPSFPLLYYRRVDSAFHPKRGRRECEQKWYLPERPDAEGGYFGEGERTWGPSFKTLARSFASGGFAAGLSCP